MLPVTSLVTAIAAVALVVLSFAVSLRRMKVGTEIGVGDDLTLLRRIRAQGNFIEYVPLGLVILALSEYRGSTMYMLWAIAGLLCAGRLSHAVGILNGSTPFRAIGMLATYSALLAGASTLAT